LDAAIVTGLAAIVGASVGVFGNLVVARSQRKLARQERDQQQIEEKFATYNDVLNINGRERILKPGEDRGWDAELYQTLIRPVLFKKLHVLDYGVRERIKEIDTAVLHRRWGILRDNEDLDALEYMLYVHLIEGIESCYPVFTSRKRR